MDNRPETEQDEQLGILGPGMSSAEYKAQQKASRKADKAQRREQRRLDKEQRRQQPKEKNPILWVMVGVLGVIVIFVVIMLAIGLRPDPKEMAKGSGYFSSDDEPELSDEGIKGVITEAYFTNDKHLCLLLTFGNGMETDQELLSLEVKLENEDGQVIATGYSSDIPDNYTVQADGTNTFLFYIAPKYVKLPADDLDTLTYEITTESNEVGASSTTAQS